MSLSNEATFELQNSHESKLLCIKHQAFINLNSETAKESEWGSLACLLALSNVVDSQIMSIYQGSGTDYDTIMELLFPDEVLVACCIFYGPEVHYWQHKADLSNQITFALLSLPQKLKK